jgi:hypothetical protein
MPEMRTEQFQLRGFSDRPGFGSAEVLSFNKGERTRRAFKGLGMSWLVSGGTVFIPVAHFFLVPGFFLFGIYVFVSRMRVAEITTRIHGACPDCEAEQDFEAGGRWELPRSMTCRACARTLRAVATDHADSTCSKRDGESTNPESY